MRRTRQGDRRLLERLERARRLKIVYDCGCPEYGGVTIRLEPGPRFGYTVFDSDGEAITAMTEDAAQSYVQNPAILDARDWKTTDEEFLVSPTVRALRQVEQAVIVFDWIDPRHVERLIAEALVTLRHLRAINGAIPRSVGPACGGHQRRLK